MKKYEQSVVFFMHVTFYRQEGCPLCDEAERMMKLVQEDYPLTWTDFDIRTDEAKHEKYMLMVPVIEKNGEPLLYGNIGYIDIIELFEK